MVKTRTQTKKQKQKEEAEMLEFVPLKKRRIVPKKQTITKRQLRHRLTSKYIKRKEESTDKPKTIDFTNEQYTSIVNAQKFNCPICLEIMIYPIITHCGHAFCLPCIQQSLKHKNACSLCRESLTYEHFKQSKLIKEIIDNLAEKTLNQAEQGQYQSRIKAFNDQDKDRRVDPEIEIGDFVDFFVNKAWSQGKVIEINDSEEDPKIKIEATHRDTVVSTLKLSSRLLARHRYFTKENTLFREFMGQFRLQISSLNQIPLFQNLINVEINPISVHPQFYQDGEEELIRFTFHIQPPGTN